MKLLFDQNISHKILKFIPELFNGSTTVKHEGLWVPAKNNLDSYGKSKNHGNCGYSEKLLKRY